MKSRAKSRKFGAGQAECRRGAGGQTMRFLLLSVPILAEFSANPAARRLCACATQACLHSSIHGLGKSALSMAAHADVRMGNTQQSPCRDRGKPSKENVRRRHAAMVQTGAQ
jgi:hypothetical protein